VQSGSSKQALVGTSANHKQEWLPVCMYPMNLRNAVSEFLIGNPLI